MVNRLDVHTFIYFELASSSVVSVCEFVQKEVDRPTRLLQFLAFVHLPFSFRSLDLLVGGGWIEVCKSADPLKLMAESVDPLKKST